MLLACMVSTAHRFLCFLSSVVLLLFQTLELTAGRLYSLADCFVVPIDDHSMWRSCAEAHLLEMGWPLASSRPSVHVSGSSNSSVIFTFVSILTPRRLQHEPAQGVRLYAVAAAAVTDSCTNVCTLQAHYIVLLLSCFR